METFLYNTFTNKREGPIRQGQYLVDGQPGLLPDGWVELVITDLPFPEYDEDTQIMERSEYADIPQKKWIREYYVRNLSWQEIEDRKPKPPSTCTPRQFRLALIHNNIDIQTIETMLNSIENPYDKQVALVEWEYALEIRIDHPLIISFATQLNITQKNLDEIFILANTFD